MANSPAGNNCAYQGALISSNGHNLDSDGTCQLSGSGDLSNTNARLDPSGLQNNGGSTQTIALFPGSPAIDAVPAGVCVDASDQRGIARPQGANCDIGAYESSPGFTLTVSKQGTASGTVTDNFSVLNCGTTCTGSYGNGASVTLTASAASGSTFAGWSGCDSTSGNQCTVITTSNKAVTATFNAQVQQFTLSLSKVGNGTGTVTSNPSGIDCGSTCSASFNSGQVVTLTATAEANSVFSSWTGCDSTLGNHCTVTMTADRPVTATFSFIMDMLTVAISPSGSGSVISADGFINCPASSCSHVYSSGVGVALTATAASGYTFSNWTGCDTVVNNQCNLTMNANRTVTANFIQQFTLTVGINPSGGGSATSNDGFVNCPASSCSHTYTNGATVTLTASAASGFIFNNWTGDCTGTGNCNLTMNGAKSVTANFTHPSNNNPPPSGPPGRAGDGNGDGVINVIDARICLQIALGFIQPTSAQRSACDVDGDGQVTLADAQKIAQFSIGQIGSLAALGTGALALTLPILLLSLVGIIWRRRSTMKWLRRRRLFVVPLFLGIGLLLTACSSISTPVLLFSHTSLAGTGYGTLTLGASSMPDGGLAAIEVKSGGLTFDPNIIHVAGITGLNGFTVLASVIDNSAGKVSFAAVNPAGGVSGGAIVQLAITMQNVGKTTVSIDTSKLVLGDVNNNTIPVSGVTVGSETISIP